MWEVTHNLSTGELGGIKRAGEKRSDDDLFMTVF